MNTSYNPLFRATRAACSELTTPEAWRWYRQQLQTSAALAHQGLTLVRRWLTSSRGQVAAVVKSAQAITLPDDTDPEQVSAPSGFAEPESPEVTANWLAVEANDFAVVESEQAIASPKSVPAAAVPKAEPEPSVLAATEQTTATDYELLDDSQELPTEANEPLPEVELPFTDDLESGPPYLSEEDDSFFDPEEDSNSLLEEDFESSASVSPADLDARIQAFMQARGISTEAEDSSSHHSPTPTSSYSATGAEFGL